MVAGVEAAAATAVVGVAPAAVVAAVAVAAAAVVAAATQLKGNRNDELPERPPCTLRRKTLRPPAHKHL